MLPRSPTGLWWQRNSPSLVANYAGAEAAGLVRTMPDAVIQSTAVFSYASNVLSTVGKLPP